MLALACSFALGVLAGRTDLLVRRTTTAAQRAALPSGLSCQGTYQACVAGHSSDLPALEAVKSWRSAKPRLGSISLVTQLSLDRHDVGGPARACSAGAHCVRRPLGHTPCCSALQAVCAGGAVLGVARRSVCCGVRASAG